MASQSERGKQSKPKSGQSSPANRQDQQEEQAQGDEEHQVLAMKAEFRGPLPPPEVLQRYEDIHPGTAERILQQFERETQHRHAIEEKLVDGQLDIQRDEIPARRLGQVFGLIIALSGIVAAAYCVSTASSAGQAWAGAGIAGFSLATLAGVFVYGRKVKETEEADKHEEQ